MKYTIDEAAEKWCPHARVACASKQERPVFSLLKHVPAFNRMFTVNEEEISAVSRCLGDKCMAWRWDSYVGTLDRLTCKGYCGESGNP